MSVNQVDGSNPQEVAFDLDGNNKVEDPTDKVKENGVFFAPSGEKFEMGLPASSAFLSNRQYTPGTDGGTTIDEREVVDLGGVQTGRLSWKELGR